MVALEEHSDSKSESQFSLGKSQQILSRGPLQGSTGMHLNVVQEMCLLTKGRGTNRENFSTTGNLRHKVKESEVSKWLLCATGSKTTGCREKRCRNPLTLGLAFW